MKCKLLPCSSANAPQPESALLFLSWSPHASLLMHLSPDLRHPPLLYKRQPQSTGRHHPLVHSASPSRRLVRMGEKGEWSKCWEVLEALIRVQHKWPERVPLVSTPIACLDVHTHRVHHYPKHYLSIFSPVWQQDEIGFPPSLPFCLDHCTLTPTSWLPSLMGGKRCRSFTNRSLRSGAGTAA